MFFHQLAENEKKKNWLPEYYVWNISGCHGWLNFTVQRHRITTNDTDIRLNMPSLNIMTYVFELISSQWPQRRLCPLVQHFRNTERIAIKSAKRGGPTRFGHPYRVSHGQTYPQTSFYCCANAGETPG